ncbi:caspase-8-like [Mantella aurantiaca]
MDKWITQLYGIINDLSTEEGTDVIFLCKDFVSIRSSKLEHLIDDLKSHGYIDQENTDLFAELLYILKRYDLLKKYFKTDREEMEKKLRFSKVAKIHPFRLLLYDLSELVPDSEFKKIKSAFSDVLPKAKLNKATSLLDAFNELEKRGVLHNLEYLKTKSEIFDDDFKKKLLEYEQNCTDEDKGEEMQSHAEDPSEASEKFYNMNNGECGICLIINNFNFEKARQNYPGCTRLENRIGTEKDETSLNEVFSNLGFRVEVKNDLEGNNILETVKSYSKKNYEQNDCFICCILSHGNTGLVYGTDGQGVAIKDLTFCFCKHSCPSLNGKPKLFFIQACQGQQPQNCVPVGSDACNASHDNNVTKGDMIPAEPDFLLGMATVMHCLAFRDPKKGSWYIQSLCKELHENQRGEDILSILTKVNEQLSKKCVSNETQMPQPWTTLSRKLVFNYQPAI